MKVCVPCNSPGGPDAVIASSFEETDLLDYYELLPDGRFEHTAQMRNCGDAACVNPVDAIASRGVAKIVVTGLTPTSLMRLHNAGVKVYLAGDPLVRVALDDLAKGALTEVTIDRFATLERTRK